MGGKIKIMEVFLLKKLTSTEKKIHIFILIIPNFAVHCILTRP
jgi:hypothetical protein